MNSVAKNACLVLIGLCAPLLYSQSITEGFESGAPGWSYYQVSGNIPYYLTTADSNSGDYSTYTYTEDAGGIITSLTNEVWLISPSMDLSLAETVDISYFQRNAQVSSETASNPTQQVVFSTNYSGSGDPFLADWYIINNTTASADWRQTTLSNALPKVENVTVAFRYVGQSTRFTIFTSTSRAWLLDDIEITSYPCSYTTTWESNSWTNGIPNATTTAVLQDDYDTELHGSFETCSLFIGSEANVSIAGSTYITIHQNFTNDGSLTVTHEGSLLMTKDEALIDGAGATEVQKTTNPLQLYDYTYWSSPVENSSLVAAFPSAPSDYFYQYVPINHDGTNDSGWQTVPGNSIMQPTVGYIAMAPLNGTFPQTQNASFSGQVNNGVQTGSVSVGNASYSWNLIGNPYPSAVDIDLFFNLPANSNLNPSVYLWTHNTDRADDGSGGYIYSSNDYASYTTGIGGTAASSGGAKATAFMASGQSFFINAIAAGNFEFNNAMRTHLNNDTFYRAQPEKKVTQRTVDRIWLNLSNDKGAFSQTLIGFTESARDTIDRYDAPSLGSGYLSLYSLINTKAFVINGRAPRQDKTEIPLGYTSYLPKNTEATISLDELSGAVQSDQSELILYDKNLHLYHNLRMSAYHFVLDQPGTYNDRFFLRIHKKGVQRSLDQPRTESLLVSSESEQLIIRAMHNSLLKNVSVFDLQGKLLFSATQSTRRHIFNSGSIASGTVLIIRAELENQQPLFKKTIKIN